MKAIREKQDAMRVRLKEKGWIGVDFDGTLATHDTWVQWDILGDPIEPMVKRVQLWLLAGYKVKIVTARIYAGQKEGDQGELCRASGVFFTNEMMIKVIQDWCIKHIGRALEVTCSKDPDMIELWDDRAIQVVPNTGRTLFDEHEAIMSALSAPKFNV